MLSKKQQTDRVNTVIGHGTSIEGKIKSTSSIRIDGEFVGEIQTEGNVLIGKEGQVRGNIEAANVTAEGHILGNMTVRHTIQLVKGCQIEGDMISETIEVEKGAYFNGRSTMVIPDQDTKGKPHKKQSEEQKTKNGNDPAADKNEDRQNPKDTDKKKGKAKEKDKVAS
ncbi:bactofilin family protein [Caldalkalibacillus salinus]|uniref:bactofilin family protein n=1 Tax=Caldalkalibacillus salinus TaxID=2803787 RepID=UPI0019204C05|nr:polymer-forming cytoskeletal protein [Caldalkalibacillus salinus]